MSWSLWRSSRTDFDVAVSLRLDNEPRGWRYASECLCGSAVPFFDELERMAVSENTQLPRPVWAISVILGLGLIGLGSILCLAPLFFPGLFVASIAVVTVGFGLVMVTLGIGLSVAGVQGWREVPARRFYMRGGAWLLALLSLGIGALGVALPGHLHAQFIFAPIHFAMITLPGLILFAILALVAGREHAMSVRRMILTLAGGAASVLLAIPVEVIGLLVSGLVGVGLVLLLPGGAAEIDRLLALLNRWAVRPPTQESELMAVLASPVVLITLGLTLGVVTPLIEEFGKTLVMGVMGIWVKPNRLTAFLWGAACGLGFAWFEGISNGALALGESLGWAGSVGVRFFATAMHALTSGVIGLGWAAFWQQRRWRLLWAYAVAVVFHALWNLNVIFSLVGMGVQARAPAIGAAVVGVGLAVQIGLILIALGGLFGVPAVLRRRER
jgi:hypothetical protein